MSRRKDRFEIVRVVPGFFLFDEAGSLRPYSRSDETSLDPGMYVVERPPGIDQNCYDERTLFYGPFQMSAEVRAMLEELRGTHGGRAGRDPGPLASCGFVVEWMRA